jgi:hypothetical protein
MGKFTLRYDGCPCNIYHLLWDRGSMQLKEIYEYLKPIHAQSSIRRSLYGLKDAGVIYKVGSDVWCFDTSKRPIEILEKITTN